MKNKRGFTLIELLVVIAIISLLVSILLPSLRKAKDLAKLAVCQGNLHSVGLATLLYGEDYGGCCPAAAPKPWLNATTQDYCVVPRLLSLPAVGGVYAPSFAVWDCPGDQTRDFKVSTSTALPGPVGGYWGDSFRGFPSWTAAGGGNLSYGYNLKAGQRDYEGSGHVRLYPPYRPSNRQSPAYDALWFDADAGRKTGLSSEESTMYSEQFVSFAWNWRTGSADMYLLGNGPHHDGNMNVVGGDGHVEPVYVDSTLSYQEAFLVGVPWIDNVGRVEGGSTPFIYY